MSRFSMIVIRRLPIIVFGAMYVFSCYGCARFSRPG